MDYKKIDFDPQNIGLFKNSVICLPHWWLAGASQLVDEDNVVGIGFDRDKSISMAKAKSECLERMVFRIWENSRINPFSGLPERPNATVGMGAHYDRNFAIEKARSETIERVCLARIQRNELRLSIIKHPPVSFILRIYLKVLGLNLKLYGAEILGKGHFAFATIDLKYNKIEVSAVGYLFGSAFSTNSKKSQSNAVLEAIRKIAFIKGWLNGESKKSKIKELIEFWMSKDGRRSVEKFVRSGLTNDEFSGELTIDNALAIQVGGLWVALCPAGDNELPIVENKNVPLV